MKQKSHSGLKKRIRVRASGSVHVDKACRNHLLVNKSKKMKKGFQGGMAVDSTRMRAIRKLMPGIVVLRKGRKTTEMSKGEVSTGEKAAAVKAGEAGAKKVSVN